jgi:hypothetical protein
LPVKAGVTADDWDFEAPHHGLAMSPDGMMLCIAGRASDYAGLVSTIGLAPGPPVEQPAVKKLTLLATLPVGDAPGWSEITADGQYCILTNTRSDDISIVSIAGRQEVARVKGGDGPKHITIASVPVSVLEKIAQAQED